MTGEDERVATRLIGELDAAKRKPIRVKPDDPLEVATTIMLLNDFSQLPVMPNKRDVKGMISWKSIGVQASMGAPCEFVRECMERPVKEIGIDAPLLDATEDLANQGYVLVRGKGDVITGIVTASDFAVQFRQLAGSFLVIEEIEHHLRRLVGGKFSPEEVTEALSTPAREPISGPDKLTLGAYGRFLERPEHWEKLGLRLDQKTFVKRLKCVTGIRNDVMHFKAKGLPDNLLVKLRNFAGLFRDLERVSNK